MSSDASGVLVMMFGVITLRLALSGAFQSYVKTGMRIPLLLTGLVLTVLGLATAWRRGSAPAAGDHLADDDHTDDHEHHRSPRVAWLLAVPLATLVLIAPAPLGSYAASRQDVAPTKPKAGFPALPAAVDGAVPLTIAEVRQRATWDTERSLDGVRVRLEGFVANAGGSDSGADAGFTLARFEIACCAADAFASTVRITGPLAANPPAPDTWLRVDAVWEAPPEIDGATGADDGNPVIELVATQVTEIPRPANPYG